MGERIDEEYETTYRERDSQRRVVERSETKPFVVDL
jgi:hypothetical protein